MSSSTDKATGSWLSDRHQVQNPRCRLLRWHGSPGWPHAASDGAAGQNVKFFGGDAVRHQEIAKKRRRRQELGNVVCREIGSSLAKCMAA